MRIVILEGTVEEVSQVLSLLPGLSSSTVLFDREESTTETQPPAVEEAGRDKLISIEFAVLVLIRRPLLSEPMKQTLGALAAKHPGWLSAIDLQEDTGYQRTQFNGMLGAFGRRTSKTGGHEKGVEFFEYKWNEELGCWMYRLQDNALTAVKQVGLT